MPRNVAHAAPLCTTKHALTTKIHLACDGRGRPLSIVITPGHRQESTQLELVLEGIQVPRGSGRERLRTCPDHLIADKGYKEGVSQPGN